MAKGAALYTEERNDDYFEIAQRILNSITLDELNAKAAKIFEGRGTMAMIYAPSSAADEEVANARMLNTAAAHKEAIFVFIQALS